MAIKAHGVHSSRRMARPSRCLHPFIVISCFVIQRGIKSRRAVGSYIQDLNFESLMVASYHLAVTYSNIQELEMHQPEYN